MQFLVQLSDLLEGKYLLPLCLSIGKITIFYTLFDPSKVTKRFRIN